MPTTYNVNPYYDDFDVDKNFYQILFKPGFAVQARELTQLQSILRDQIEKFGNHIFKNGSVVIPGNSFADLSVPYIKLESSYSGEDITISDFEDKVVVGATTGLKAVITKAVATENSDPITFYLSYTSGSANGDITFQNSEEIYLEEDSGIRANLISSSSTGVGSIAYVNAGVYYVQGTFVSNEAQSVIISKYNSTPNVRVLFAVSTDIIDSSEDTSLLDPALGSYNYIAPGADRVKISLTLTTLGVDATIDDDYVELMRYRNGVLEQHAKTPQYSEIEKVLAQRVFDESGNYVVNGFKAVVRENLKTSTNGGIDPNGNNQILTVEVSPGKAYIGGFPVEKIASTKINIDKARTPDHIANTEFILRPEYGQYLVISNITGSSFNLRDRGIINLYNVSNTQVANAASIGSARAIAIDYLDGDPADAVYKLWVSNLSMTGANTIDAVGAVTFGSNGKAFVCTQYTAPVNSGAFEEGEIISHPSGREATVKYWDAATSTLYAYKHLVANSVPRGGDIVTANTSNTTSTISAKNHIVNSGQSGLVFKLPKDVPNALRDENNVIDLSYTSQKELTINTDGSGNGSVSITSGTINPIEVGSFVAIGPSGVVDNDLFSLNISGSTLTLNGGPTSSVVKAYVSILYDNVSPKTKTPTTVSQTFTSPGANTITLSKTDVYELTSVVDSTGIDVTPSYILFDGQTDYAYTRATLRLRAGATAPTGNVTVSYKHYAHSIAGDFFCIDSYSSIANFLETGRKYTSDTTGITYDLAACVDFRPSVGEDGEFTGTGSRRNDIVLNGTTFTSALQYYIPRIDSLIVDPDGQLRIARGVPSETPYPPALQPGSFEIYGFLVPPYTVNAEDVRVRRKNVNGFRMSDIQQIKDRVERLENFVLISEEENNLINFSIVDAETGLDRYKTGFLVENFTFPLPLADTTNQKYASTFLLNSLVPQHEPMYCPLEILGSSTGYVEKNNYIMLPYTEVAFASQPLSSRTTNLNPFLVFKWNGILDVVPPSDSWVEIVDLPEVLESKTEVVYRYVSQPCPSSDEGGYSPSTSTPSPTWLDPVYNVTVTNSNGKKVVQQGSYVGGVDIDVNKAKDYRIETTVVEVSPGVYQEVNSVSVTTTKPGQAQITQTSDGYVDISSGKSKGLDLVNFDSVSTSSGQAVTTNTVRSSDKKADKVQTRLDNIYS